MIYLTKHSTQAAYDAVKDNLAKPQVALTVDNNVVHYQPLTPPTPTAETRVVAIFNVEDTSEPIQILGTEYTIDEVSSIEIDGVEQLSVVSAYTFSTTGEHTVKYTLSDPTSIGNEFFMGCYGITSIVIPNSVTSIDMYAFTNCNSLTSVTIGSGVTSISGCAFETCESLIQIISLATTAPTLGFEVFGYVASNGTLYVPQGSSGYDAWMSNDYGFLGGFGWTMVEQ